ncbi:MAG: hypothetical protein AAF065_08990 [Verrucomicrobiota bacterium]
MPSHVRDACKTNSDAVEQELVLNITGGPAIRYTITSPAGDVPGSYGSAGLDSDAPGNLSFYFWTQEAYRVRFYVESVTVIPLLLNLIFETTDSGTFTGTGNPGTAGAFSTSGTFTFGAAP